MKKLDEFKNLTNKLEAFENIDSLLKYVETGGDFIQLFSLLSDNEKLVVVKKDYYLRQNDYIKNNTILCKRLMKGRLDLL